MRQVPHYLIIGNGRVAKHFCHYFDLLHLAYYHWHRATPQALVPIAASASHILLLISDSQIELFIEQHPYLKEKKLLHFSGCHISAHAYGAHPLQTFSHELYTLEQYQKIAFIIEEEGPPFHELLPLLPNPHFALAAKLKPYYHALCVMANNFTTLLWQKLFREFTEKLALPAECAYPLLQQTISNLIAHPTRALTGPLARGDKHTLQKNLQALDGDPFQTIYAAFIAVTNLENSK
jgi:hypothetical protein